jgi:hypothetical protein
MNPNIQRRFLKKTQDQCLRPAKAMLSEPQIVFIHTANVHLPLKEWAFTVRRSDFKRNGFRMVTGTSIFTGQSWAKDAVQVVDAVDGRTQSKTIVHQTGDVCLPIRL